MEESMKSYRSIQRGFTLVEILIVVIILGILAAIVIPQFSNASSDARRSSVVSQLQTLRSQIELFKLQHGDVPPQLITTGWSVLTGTTTYGGTTFGPYMQTTPVNPLAHSSTVAAAAAANVGWVYNETTGAISATADAAGTAFVE
ncbi:MAG: prepilin-type N-terminal cleavage/methylation domain-containing protein [Phycisphaerales bacterium]|nr:prepilin-type N-terminal cleavage/methylation domain-containing protein [Phycisphaerales bacterium]